jgi:hypothetical protein
MAELPRGASCLRLDIGLKSAYYHHQQLDSAIWGSKKEWARLSKRKCVQPTKPPQRPYPLTDVRHGGAREDKVDMPNRKELLKL